MEKFNYGDIVVSFYKKHPNFPACKLKDYLKIKKEINKYYIPITSNKQIQTLVKYCKNDPKNVRYFERLLLLIYKLNGNRKFNINILNKPDREIFKILKNNKRRGGKPLECYSTERHSQEFKCILKTAMKNSNKIIIDSYLDIACGNCKKTELTGKLLGLKNNQIYGTDIENWYLYSNEKRDKIKINFKRFEKNGKLPFEDKSMSLVSIIMTIHHLNGKELITMLKEIYRIVKPNGYFVIREHDAVTDFDYLLCDIEHSLYNDLKENSPNFYETYYGRYFDWLEWNYIISKFKFNLLFKKMDQSKSFIYNVSPTRTYYAVYQKI